MTAAIAKPIHVPAAYGEVPGDWAWSRLDDISEGVFDCPHSTPKLTAEGPFVVRTQDVMTGIFRTDQAGHVSEETYSERVARVTPRHGDLLYSREGTYFGIAAEVPVNTRVCLGQRMVLIRPDKCRLDFRFLRHWLNSPIMAAHIQGYRDGTVAERLNLPTIRALPILVPPLSEQKAIAAVLGALDDKIELNRRMKVTLEAMGRALFESWFVDFDPVRAKAEGRCLLGLDETTAALFPAEFQDSELGEIPQGWRAGVVGEAFNITMGQSPPGESYNEEGEGLPFFQGRRDFGFRFPTRRVFCTAPTRLAAAGDTLVSVRAPVGDINMADEACCIGRGVAAVRHKTGASSFTYRSMANHAANFERFEAHGTVFGAINKNSFQDLACVIPPADITAAFERLAAPIDAEIRLLEHQSRTLTALRDSLLPRLLSGELQPHSPPL